MLRGHLKNIIGNRRSQGCVVEGLHNELNRLPDSYDALDAFARQLAHLPMRDDWSYIEPDELELIWAECDPSRPLGMLGAITPGDATARLETAFRRRILQASVPG